MKNNLLLLTSALCTSIAWSLTAHADDGAFKVESNLRAGVAKVDITPSDVRDFEVTGHRRKVTGVRDPLRAGMLILSDGETQAAIVTLDTIGAWDEMVKLARQRIEKETGVPAANVMVAASHNHSGPSFGNNVEWGRELITRLGEAAKEAAAKMRPVSVGYGEDRIGFGINRRKVINGRAVVRLNPDGPNDPRVKVLRFDDGKSLTPMAVVMHAVCHPCFFTWGDKGSRPYPNGYPKMSADFPGEAQSFVEMCYAGSTSSLFLQGCAGDIRPNLPGHPYRCADEADIQWAGRDLGGAVVRTLARSVTREQLRDRAEYYRIRVASTVVSLPGKQGRIDAELMALKLGPYLLLTMPGEPMVEYGFKLEKAIADRAIPIIVGYANGNIGYIATGDAYEVGGYEPNTSKLTPEAEPVILTELSRLADGVVGDVFESFSKHPKDVKRRQEAEQTRKARREFKMKYQQHWARRLMKHTILTVLICVLAATASADDRPNIVLVMADDHGYGDTGFTGHPFVKTPHLDAMAQAGVVFNRFYASAPVCSPTRASVMTGRHPFRVNVPNHGHYLRPHETTIAEALKNAGYVTGHFGKWHIGSVQRDSPTSPGGAGFDQWLSGLNFFDNDPYLSRNGHYEHLKGPGTVISMDATIDFLKKHARGDKPIFAVTWFPSPHDPQAELPQDMPNAATLYNDQSTKKPGYFREITLLDQQVGKLRQALRDLDIAENTLLFYCSDNGGLVAESSGGRARKGSIYEGGLRVPAVMEWPARYKAQSIDTPAFASDLYPTLVAISGATVDHQPPLDGIDLTPVLAGTQTQRPPMGFWHGHTQGQGTWSDRIIKALLEAKAAGQPNPHPDRILKNVEQFPTFGADAMRGHAAWNAWPWKLHRIEKNGKVTFELYNLTSDPMEANDLGATETKRVAAMKGELETWQRSVLASWSGADYIKRSQEN